MLRRLLIAGGGGSFTLEDDLPAGVLNVLNYAADPTGSADSTTAINNALASLTGNNKVLVFPPGTYKTSGGHTIPATTAIVGYGADRDNAISQINCTSSTANLFTLGGAGVIIRDLGLKNTAGSTPSAGTAIKAVTGTGDFCTYEGLWIERFFVNADLRYGTDWKMRSCYLHGSVSHGLRIDNIDTPDAGDQIVDDIHIYPGSLTDSTTAYAIYQTGGGGTKISNLKVNGAVGAKFFGAIAVAIPNSVQTSDWFLANASIENLATHGIVMTTGATSAVWGNIHITGTEISLANSANGYGIFVEGGASNISRVHVTGSAILTTSSTQNAVTLKNVTGARLVGITRAGFSGMYGDDGGNSDVVQSAAA